MSSFLDEQVVQALKSLPDTPSRAFLSFSIGPVQKFIASARSVRDLWSGSMILSWLTMRGMEQVERAGGTFVFPRIPDDVIDKGGDAQPDLPWRMNTEVIKTPCIPNTFLTMVESGKAAEIAEKCEKAARDAWDEAAEAVWSQIDDHFGEYRARWDSQMDNFFDITVTILDWAAAAGERKDFPKDAKERFKALRRQALNVHGANRMVRFVPSPEQPANGERVPMKCTIMGSYEQLGPAGFAETRAFWDKIASNYSLNGVHIRDGERLCAISLAKRFFGPAYVVEQYKKEPLRLKPEELRFPDTATIAAAHWLEKARIDPDEIRRTCGDWNGQWLSLPNREAAGELGDKLPEAFWNKITLTRKDIGYPPKYFAVLAMDGDKMGELFTKAGAEVTAEISGKLAEFASRAVPPIVGRHDGILIYAGGDDVLALLPAINAVKCADEIRAKFQETIRSGDGSVSGRTMSAGIAVCHYKEDLRDALESARKAEAAAKNMSRNALCLMVCRRSGEHSSFWLPWEVGERNLAKIFSDMVKAFQGEDKNTPGASNGWVYHLAEEMPVLRNMGPEPAAAELKRHLNRTEKDPTKNRLAKALGDGVTSDELPEKMADLFQAYQQAYPRENARRKHTGADGSNGLKAFITLAQSASFIARGRDND